MISRKLRLVINFTFNKRHANRTHLRELEDFIVAKVDGLRKMLGEFCVVEDFKGATWRNFTHGRAMESVMIIAIHGLYKHCRV